MAQHKKTDQPETPAISEILMTSGTPVGNVIETDADTFGAGEQHTDVTPFARIVRALETTVETDAPIPGTIQRVVADVMPANRAQAQELLRKMERFRVAAERGHAVTQEMFYAKFH